MQDLTVGPSYQQAAVQDVGDNGLLQTAASDEEALDELSDGAAVAQLGEEREKNPSITQPLPDYDSCWSESPNALQGRGGNNNKSCTTIQSLMILWLTHSKPKKIY